MLAALVLSVVATVSTSASISGSVVNVVVKPDSDLQRGGFFGAKVTAIPDEVRDRFKLEAGNGVLIGEVIPDSTAAAGGFKAGDVLLALNGAKIASTTAFIQAIASRKAGTSAQPRSVRASGAASHASPVSSTRPFSTSPTVGPRK